MSNRPAFRLGDITTPAWELVSGVKLSVWAVAISMILLSALIQWVMTHEWMLDVKQPMLGIRFLLLPIITNVIIAPFYAGAVMVAVKRARGDSVDFKTGYQYFHRAVALMATAAITSGITTLLMLAANVTRLSPWAGAITIWCEIAAAILSLMVYVFCVLAVPFVADRGLSPIKALLESARRISHCWVRVFILFLYAYLLLLVCMLPVFVGAVVAHPLVVWLGIIVCMIAMVWILPYLLLLQGVLYKQLNS